MSGTKAHNEGITNPPIDSLLEKVPSKYALVVYAAARARQINTYNQQIADGMFSTPGPLVDCRIDDKPISIALQEMEQGLLQFSRIDPEEEAAKAEAAKEAAADFASDIVGDIDFFADINETK